MKSKKFLSVIMCFALIACMLPYASLSAFADDEIHTSTDGSWKYRIIDDQTAEIYNNDEPAYVGSDVNITVPDTIDGYEVVGLGDFALYSLSDIQTVSIGANLTSLGITVLAMTTALESITVDEDNKNFSSIDGVLFNKEKTELICYPANKSGETYTIPYGVENIGRDAFIFSMNLKNVVFSDTVEYIGTEAFAACSSLEEITLPNKIGVLEPYMFYMCSSLTDVILPNTLEIIGELAFGECTSLTEITIPSSVTYIDENAFTDSGLTTIKGYWDTEAEHFANNKGYEFISLDILGDIDYDGSVTLADYAVIKTHLTDDNLKFMKVADYNTDGAIDAFDLFYIDLAVNQQDA